MVKVNAPDWWLVPVRNSLAGAQQIALASVSQEVIHVQGCVRSSDFERTFCSAASAQAPKSVKVQSTWPGQHHAPGSPAHSRRAYRQADARLGEGRDPRRRADRAASRCSTPPTRRCSTASTPLRTTGSARIPAAALFAGPPGGPFGMDHMDFLGWLAVGGGLEMWRDFYQNDLKLNVIVWPAPVEPAGARLVQKPLKGVADFKGLRAAGPGSTPRSTPSSARAWSTWRAAKSARGAARGHRCAEWVGGVEDLRLGLPGVLVPLHPRHAREQLHRRVRPNLDVWKGLSPQQQEAVNSAVKDTFITWITRWQKQNADAIEEMIKKHGVQIRRTPPDILLASLKAWTRWRRASVEAPDLQEVYESQREYAAKVVPAKRYMFPPYSFAAELLLRRKGRRPRRRRMPKSPEQEACAGPRTSTAPASSAGSSRCARRRARTRCPRSSASSRASST